MLNRVAILLVVFYIGAALVVHAAGPTPGSMSADDKCSATDAEYKCAPGSMVQVGSQKKPCLSGTKCQAKEKGAVGATCQGHEKCVAQCVGELNGKCNSPELPRESANVDYYGSNGVGSVDIPNEPVPEYIASEPAAVVPESGSTYMESSGAEPSVQGENAGDTLKGMADTNTASPVDTSGQTAQDIINQEHGGGLNQISFVPDGGGTSDVLNSPGGAMYNYTDNQSQSLTFDSFGGPGGSGQDTSGDALAAANCGGMCQLQTQVSDLKQEITTLAAEINSQDLGMLTSTTKSLFPDNSTANGDLAGYPSVTVSVVPTSVNSSGYGADGSYDLTDQNKTQPDYISLMQQGVVPVVTGPVADPANWMSEPFMNSLYKNVPSAQ